jgi:ATP-dependent DNA ligase
MVIIESKSSPAQSRQIKHLAIGRTFGEGQVAARDCLLEIRRRNAYHGPYQLQQRASQADRGPDTGRSPRRNHQVPDSGRGVAVGRVVGGPPPLVIPHYAPMIPTLVPEPFHRPGWIYEEKVDGWRMLAYKYGTHARLLSRNRVDHARRFRMIAAAIAALPGQTLVLDGEVAIFDQQLRSRFELLRG